MLQHVGIELRPSDLGRALEFFAALGFRRVEPPPALADGFTWLERGGTQIHLMHEEHPTVPPRAHLALVTPDIGTAVAALREQGFEVGAGRQHWGVPRAHAIAPGGHRVELMAAPPPAR